MSGDGEEVWLAAVHCLEGPHARGRLPTVVKLHTRHVAKYFTAATMTLMPQDPVAG